MAEKLGQLILAENIPNWMKYMHLQIQKAQ